MEKTLASNTKKEIRNLIYDFFSDECDVDKIILILLRNWMAIL
jgi:hypothetical protein